MDGPLVTWDPDGVRAWADAAPEDGGVLVHSLRGFIDAGRAGLLVSDHLLELSEPVRVATFDIDRLLDYRSRRPEMTFSVNQWTSYDEPHLELDMLRDVEGTPFLLLHGFEPDILWERYIAAVREAVERLGVDLVAGSHGIPMAVPHTRPLTATLHGTDQELLPDTPSMFGTVTVPASAQNLLEYRFGQWGLAMVNIAVHVPHYLAQSSYPQAAQRALASLEAVAGLALAPEDLDPDAARADEEIARQLGESEEVQALVDALENQYDAFHEARGRGLPIDDGELPSADEIAAEFEKFLAQERRDPPTGA
ncbi:PAC2 family protein [Demequina lignilytica]|uniref:PAC2 family protein n=1 Tax=Demequina lignilytica TaxID=3051663 RepID=A0AB35MJX8_9MICO|nr:MULTISPECIES: PAC2 family protein [unclassified Demequina]MDN4483978.1 PAC2 family protein [Demequina sp. SYSU T0a273]MDN4491554.1 PAC2 family protein [Demequina sp. SYSU T00068]